MNSNHDWQKIPSQYNWVWMAGQAWLGAYEKPKWDWISGHYILPRRSVWGYVKESSYLKWTRSIVKDSLERRP